MGNRVPLNNYVNRLNSKALEPLIDIVYYTDPLCCWSWGMEPQVRRLQFEFRDTIHWRYCAGGLLDGWHRYGDGLKPVQRPLQMGPLWMHAEQVTGMPMDATIWMRDPPESSYPACVAWKAAALQSVETGKRYLRLLREAVMIRGINIAKKDNLYELAGRLMSDHAKDFDPALFQAHMDNGTAEEAFLQDLEETSSKQIARFPTIVIKNYTGGEHILTGYHAYEALMVAILPLAPQLAHRRLAADEHTYRAYWGALTPAELNAAIQPSRDMETRKDPAVEIRR